MPIILRPFSRFCKVNSSQKDFPDSTARPDLVFKQASFCLSMKDNPKITEIFSLPLSTYHGQSFS